MGTETERQGARSAPTRSTGASARTRRGAGLPAARIGVLGGLVGMLCCVGPTVLALLGVVSAATAYTWAEQLYGGYAWWFRLGGLAVTVGLLVWALRRRRVCSLAGAAAARRRLVLAVVIAVVTYAVLYGLTTVAGSYVH